MQIDLNATSDVFLCHLCSVNLAEVTQFDVLLKHQWLVLVFNVTLDNVMLMQSNLWTCHYSPSPILIHQSACDLLTLQFDLCMLMEKVLMKAGLTDGACIELDCFY